MRIEKWKHVVDGHGSIYTDPMIRMSRGEGCGLQGCHCSDGYWIMISKGRIDNVVEGLTCFFADQEEMHKFLVSHELFAGVGDGN